MERRHRRLGDAGRPVVWTHILDTKALLFGIATAVLAFPFVWLAQRWAAKRWADRFMADVMARTSASGGRLTLKMENLTNPELEGDFFVHIFDTGATCSRPDGKSESVQWNDLERVEILTTDDGQFAPDQFWYFDWLHGRLRGSVGRNWRSGAIGSASGIARLQK